MTLELDRGKRVNIHTDSHYVFASFHGQGKEAPYHRGKDYQNKQEVLNLLKAVWDPKQVSMIHCLGHKKGDSTEAIVNQRVDQAAKSQKSLDTTIVLLPAPTLPGVPPTRLRVMTSSETVPHFHQERMVVQG